jgi:UDP-galactopyranose mutase
MTRCARESARVYFFEEPVFHDGATPRLEVTPSDGVRVVVPHLPAGIDEARAISLQRALLDRLIDREGVADFVAWYYTPMAIPFSDHLKPAATIYDCMDELSSFKDAPAALRQREVALMRRAGLVLTGGQSLYEAKRHQHRNIHPFPSSVDVDHFAAARRLSADPDDQASIPRPRLGFFGVIDERMDIPLLAAVARARPDWHLVLLGPIVKIDPASLPRDPNIHYLGSKTYAELPRYIAGWDVALLPFARNEATRFISPTKTPEYLAGGKPVVSTSIRDVVRPYGQQGLVRIADDPESFVAACDAAMREDAATRLRDADAFLRQTSWDGTWRRIRLHVDDLLHRDGAHGDVAAGGLAV